MHIRSISSTEFAGAYIGLMHEPPGDAFPTDDLESNDCRPYFRGRRWQDLDYSEFYLYRDCFSLMDTEAWNYYTPSILLANLNLEQDSVWIGDYADKVETHLQFDCNRSFARRLSAPDRRLIARAIATIGRRFTGEGAALFEEMAREWWQDG